MPAHQKSLAYIRNRSACRHPDVARHVIRHTGASGELQRDYTFTLPSYILILITTYRIARVHGWTVSSCDYCSRPRVDMVQAGPHRRLPAAAQL